MKKIIIPLALLLTTFVFAENSTLNHDIELKNSLLWKISGKDIVQPSYLYGTMHLVCGNESISKKKVQNAISKSSRLYLEVDMDDPNLMADMMKIMSKGKKIKDIEDDDIKQHFLELATERFKMNKSMLENSPLFNILSMLAFKAMPSCDKTPSGVDQQLMAAYTKVKKDIYGLETIDQQMELISKTGMFDTDALIKSLEEFGEMQSLYKGVMDVYLNENVRGLFMLMATPNKFTTQQDVEKILDILLFQRNKNWVAQIPAIAKQQPTFFGVGAGHLGGDIGVINLLRQQGFTVEAVMD